jgi:hypothetical protein
MNKVPTLIVLLIGSVTGSVLAQSGPALILKPWQPEALVETYFTASIFGEADTDNGFDLDLNIYEGQARGRFNADAEDPYRIAVGIDVLFMDIDTSDPTVPDQLTEQRIGVGGRIGEWEGWTFDIVAGVGFAGDDPYADDNAWFGHGTLVATLAVDERTSWVLALNYNGNRSFLPDVPLPSVSYRVIQSKELIYVLGFPISQLIWRPDDQWTIDVSYFVPFDFKADVKYRVIEELELFGTFTSRVESFHIDGARDNDRIFFRQRRAEGGLRWIPCTWFDAEIAGGFAFDQEFSHGWNAIDSTAETEVDDTPYLRAGVNLRF